jgi:hypothetical protein
MEQREEMRFIARGGKWPMAGPPMAAVKAG